jgi:hypothetical protein
MIAGKPIDLAIFTTFADALQLNSVPGLLCGRRRFIKNSKTCNNIRQDEVDDAIACIVDGEIDLAREKLTGINNGRARYWEVIVYKLHDIVSYSFVDNVLTPTRKYQIDFNFPPSILLILVLQMRVVHAQFNPYTIFKNHHVDEFIETLHKWFPNEFMYETALIIFANFMVFRNARISQYFSYTSLFPFMGEKILEHYQSCKHIRAYHYDTLKRDLADVNYAVAVYAIMLWWME